MDEEGLNKNKKNKKKAGHEEARCISEANRTARLHAAEALKTKGVENTSVDEEFRLRPLRKSPTTRNLTQLPNSRDENQAQSDPDGKHQSPVLCQILNISLCMKHGTFMVRL